MMLKIFRERLVRLGRDDDGVALVVTLAVFFFLYLFCAGVFAVGNAVKERIHLQNAVDAAAYSAAVTQADALSRIATINRAMAWTYEQMTKRQMDYIVHQWLRHTADHYAKDRRRAQKAGSAGRHRHTYWDIGPSKAALPMNRDRNGVIVNGGGSALVEDEWSGGVRHWGIKSYCSDFVSTHQSGSSFYGRNLPSAGTIRRMEAQLNADKGTIRDMNDALLRLTDGTGGQTGMARRIEDAARAILKANVPSYMAGQCDVLVEADPTPRTSYMRVMGAKDEKQFLSWADDETIRRKLSDVESAPEAIFGEGAQSGSWFPLQSLSEGIQRKYVQRSSVLKSEWWWCSWRYRCTQHSWPNCPHRIVRCSQRCHGECGPSGDWNHACLKAGDLRNDYRDEWGHSFFDGETAKPLMLTKDYFGEKGTITVGLVRRRGNPWGAVLGTVTRGLYSAFNPFNDTCCFASAKAGYKLYSLNEGWEYLYNGESRAFKDSRDYCIDWKEPRQSRHNEIWVPVWRHGRIVRWRRAMEWVREKDGTIHLRPRRTLDSAPWRQSWNLTQSDWDAVMIPVRQAGALAVEREQDSHYGWMKEVARGNVSYRYEPEWTAVKGDIVQTLVSSSKWRPLTGTGAARSISLTRTVRAGGGHDADPRGRWGRNLVDETRRWNSWTDIPEDVERQDGTVNCKWGVQNAGQLLEWSRLSEMMYH